MSLPNKDVSIVLAVISVLYDNVFCLYFIHPTYAEAGCELFFLHYFKRTCEFNKRFFSLTVGCKFSLSCVSLVHL
jgi:hypothetical protein